MKDRIPLLISTLALAIVALMAIGMIPPLNIFNAPSRTSTLIIEDAAGAPRMILTTRPNGVPMLSMMDAAGNVRLEASLTPTDAPGISLLSSNGKSMPTASIRAAGNQPEITLADSEGVQQWRVWLGENGEIKTLSNEDSD